MSRAARHSPSFDRDNQPRGSASAPEQDNEEPDAVERYKILRHLFSEAVESSVSDRRWVIFGTFTDPGRTILTEYQNAASGDRIKCQSFDFSDGVYRKQMFTFTQQVQEPQ